MKTKVTILLCSAFIFCLLLGLLTSSLNVYVKSTKRKLVVKGIVNRTVNFGEKAVAYVKKLYGPKEEEGKGWFVLFYQNFPQGIQERLEVSTSTLIDPSP